MIELVSERVLKHSIIKTFTNSIIILARAERFELPSTVLETGMLPLHHARVYYALSLQPRFSSFIRNKVVGF